MASKRVQKLITESASHYQHLEKMSLRELLVNINREDQNVPLALRQALPQIEALTQAVVDKLRHGGRLFYVGAGTSGRLGILDASEIPPTYGLPHGRVLGIIAGGDEAIRRAVEGAEDDKTAGWETLVQHQINTSDIVIGIAASGSTPYTVGALKGAQAAGIVTGCIICNKTSPLAAIADFPVILVVGPEFVTGSTRMKAGSAQKLALNMISTAAMIQLGHVRGNKMVDMALSNKKLVERATRMVAEALQVNEKTAAQLIKKHKNVRAAIEKGHANP